MTILAAAGPLYKMLVGTILSHCWIKYHTTYVMYVPTISPCLVRFCQLWNLDKCGCLKVPSPCIDYSGFLVEKYITFIMIWKYDSDFI